MNAGEFSSEQLLKWLFTDATLGTRPTTWYVGLHTANPTLDGSAAEVSDANYVRQAVNFVADQPVADEAWRVRNDSDVVFPATDGAVTITHVTVFDASTAGNCLAVLALSTSSSLAPGGVYTIPINDLTITGE